MFGSLSIYSYVSFVIRDKQLKYKDMNNTIIKFNDQLSNDLFNTKLERTYWSEVNKRYLLRVYEPMKLIVENVTKPKWSQVICEMVGYVHPGYYSCVYKSLKEIGVIQYNKYQRCLEKGPNWDRFYDEYEGWDWFYMNTSSGCLSYETKTKGGLEVRKVYN